jgi:phosphate transport system permease protein
MQQAGYLRRKGTNGLMLGLSGLAAAICIIILAIILGYTVYQGISYLNLDLITHVSTPPGEPGGGIRNEIIGTAILVALASVMALPVGVMAGVFLSEFGRPGIAAGVRFAADILAGVPSIIVGVFAYAIVVRPMHGFSALAGGAALAVIMIPIVARTAEESLRLVPNSMREAALALGITRWRAVVSVIIPGALTGIVTGIVLAVARVAGETAPLLFTALGSNFGFTDLLNPIASLPWLIYNHALSPYADWHAQAGAAALVLVILVLGISVVVRLVSRRRG